MIFLSGYCAGFITALIFVVLVPLFFREAAIIFLLALTAAEKEK